MHEALKAQARILGIDITETASGQFDAYLRELLKWNGHTNLTGITEPGEIITKHFIDSLTVIRAIPAGAQTCIDIGSGAGFPGIPLKIIRPELEITLADATAKKIEFLEHVISMLGLTGIRAVHGRAEILGHEPHYRESFDIAFARAVAQLSTLAELALPFVKVGGTFIAQKNAGSEEIDEAARAIEELGGLTMAPIPVEIPDLAGRQLVVISKIASTPEKYPRRAGIPAKRPLD